MGVGTSAVPAAVSPGADVPSVSVIIPCLNEEAFIEEAVRSILRGSYPAERLEVLVVDGRSADRSRTVVERIAGEDARVRLVDNPRRSTPAALNAGIRAARGEVVVRADAHTDYPRDFVLGLVRGLKRTGADAVGPRVENGARDGSAMCTAIRISLESAFATGSTFRYRRTDGPVDAVVFGCWHRAIFDKVGFFDEKLLRNQDIEMSSRIGKYGGRLSVISDVSVRYYPRATLREHLRHGATTGMWNAFTHRLHPHAFRLRHFLPSLFFGGVMGAAALAGAGVLALQPGLVALSAAIVMPYALANLGVSFWLAVTRGRPELLPLIAIALAGYHFAYGYGIAKGWLLVATGQWRSRLGGGTKEARLS